MTFTGSLRARFYAWDWFQPATGQNQYEYSGNLLRLNFAEKLNAWDWDAEFAVPFLLGLPTGAADPAPQGALGLGSNYYAANGNRQNTAMIFPKQLFVRFDGLGGRRRPRHEHVQGAVAAHAQAESRRRPPRHQPSTLPSSRMSKARRPTGP